MSGSTIPAALTALVTVWQAAGLTGVTVVKGPVYDPPANFLAVAWDRSGEPAVVANKSGGGADHSRRTETFSVSSLLSFSYDDDDIEQVVTRLFGAFDLLDAALFRDKSLGGAVMAAQITDYDLTPILTEAGTVADLRMTVSVQAIK